MGLIQSAISFVYALTIMCSLTGEVSSLKRTYQLIVIRNHINANIFEPNPSIKLIMNISTIGESTLGDERSMEKIRLEDLKRLAKIAEEDRVDFFQRNRYTARLYQDRLLCVTLAQGAALHYIDGTTGVKDFDVWTFYHKHQERPFPYRRRGVMDFGDPRFGLSPESPAHFTGARVDLIGRSIDQRVGELDIEAAQRYLSEGRTKTARLLAEKAMVVLEPTEDMGKIIWPVVG